MVPPPAPASARAPRVAGASARRRAPRPPAPSAAPAAPASAPSACWGVPEPRCCTRGAATTSSAEGVLGPGSTTKTLRLREHAAREDGD